MTTIVSEENLITKEDCDNNVKNMTDKIDKLAESINSIRVDIAGLPEKIIDKTDSKYAGKKLERDVDELWEKHEKQKENTLKEQEAIKVTLAKYGVVIGGAFVLINIAVEILF